MSGRSGWRGWWRGFNVQGSSDAFGGRAGDYDAEGRIVGIEVLYVLPVWTPLEETVAYQQLVGIGKKEGHQADHGFEPAANLDFCGYGKKQNCQSLTFLYHCQARLARLMEEFCHSLTVGSNATGDQPVTLQIITN